MADPIDLLIDEIEEYSIPGLIQRLEDLRGRQIRLLPSQFDDPTLWAAWVAVVTEEQPTETNRRQHFGSGVGIPGYDLIAYEERTIRLHQEHNILHELAHIILGHPTIVVEQDQITLNTIHEAIKRKGERLKTEREREAEEMASRLQLSLVERARIDNLLNGTASTPLWQDLIVGLSLDQ